MPGKLSVADPRRQQDFHWDLQTCQDPPCVWGPSRCCDRCEAARRLANPAEVHFALTLPSAGNAELFLSDLQAAMKTVKAFTQVHYSPVCVSAGLLTVFPFPSG